MLKKICIMLAVFLFAAASVCSATLEEKLKSYFTGWWMDRDYPFHLRAKFSNGVIADAYISKFETKDESAPFGRGTISGGEHTYIALAVYDKQSNVIRIDGKNSERYENFPEELFSKFYGCTDKEWKSKGLDDKRLSADAAKSLLYCYQIDYGYVSDDNMLRLYDFPSNCIVFDKSISMPLVDSRINVYYNEETDEFSYQMKNVRNLQEPIEDWNGLTQWHLLKDGSYILSKSQGRLVFPSSFYNYVSAGRKMRGGGVPFFEIGTDNFRMNSEGSDYELDLSNNMEIVGLSLKRIRRL